MLEAYAEAFNVPDFKPDMLEIFKEGSRQKIDVQKGFNEEGLQEFFVIIDGKKRMGYIEGNDLRIDSIPEENALDVLTRYYAMLEDLVKECESIVGTKASS